MLDMTPSENLDEARRLVVVKATRRVFLAWSVNDRIAAHLCGMSPSLWAWVKAGRKLDGISPEQFRRMAAIIGCYRNLHTFIQSDIADQWVNNANVGPLFNGLTPLTYMQIRGDLAIDDVHRHLQAACEGY